MVQRKRLFLGLLLCVLSLSSVSARDKFLPQIGAGGVSNGTNFRTLVYLTNSSNSPATVRIDLFDDEGQPLAFRFNNSGHRPTGTFSVAAKSTRRIVLTSSNRQIQDGWAQISGASSVGVNALLQLFEGPSLVAEAGVLSARTRTSFRLVRDGSSGAATGFALANPNPGPATITMRQFSNGGTLVGSNTLSVPANGHVSGFLDAFLPAAPEDGSVSVGSSLPVAPVTVRVLGHGFAVSPVFSESSSDDDDDEENDSRDDLKFESDLVPRFGDSGLVLEGEGEIEIKADDDEEDEGVKVEFEIEGVTDGTDPADDPDACVTITALVTRVDGDSPQVFSAEFSFFFEIADGKGEFESLLSQADAIGGDSEDDILEALATTGTVVEITGVVVKDGNGDVFAGPGVIIGAPAGEPDDDPDDPDDPDDGEESEVERTIDLLPPDGAPFPDADGEAKVEYEEEGSEVEQEFEVEVEGLPPDTEFAVVVTFEGVDTPIQIGTLRTNEEGEGELEIEVTGVVLSLIGGEITVLDICDVMIVDSSGVVVLSGSFCDD